MRKIFLERDVTPTIIKSNDAFNSLPRYIRAMCVSRRKYQHRHSAQLHFLNDYAMCMELIEKLKLKAISAALNCVQFNFIFIFIAGNCTYF